MQRMESEKNISTMIYEPFCSQLADNHGMGIQTTETAPELSRLGVLPTPVSRVLSVHSAVATLQVWDVCSKLVTTPESLQAHTTHSLARTLWTGYTHTITRHTFSDSLKFSGFLMSCLNLCTYSSYCSCFNCLCVSFDRFATVQDCSTLIKFKE